MPSVVNFDSSWHLEVSGGLAVGPDDVGGAGGLQLSYGLGFVGLALGAEVLSLTPDRGRWALIGTGGLWMRVPIRMEHTVLLPGLELVGGIGGGGLGELASTFRVNGLFGVSFGRLEPFLRAGFRVVGPGGEQAAWRSFDVAIGLRIRIGGEALVHPRAYRRPVTPPPPPPPRNSTEPRSRSERVVDVIEDALHR